MALLKIWKKASRKAMAQFNEMNDVIHDVRGSIHFLSEQTRLTNEAVSKSAQLQS